MAEYLSDDEELEKLKRWWRESGKQTLAMIVLLVAGYFGWQGWQDHQQERTYSASALYDQMLEASFGSEVFSETQKAQITHLAISLIDQYDGTQYADYAKLLMARLAVEEEDLETAVSYLTQVMKKADRGIALVARLRLARLEAARGDLDKALSLLNVKESPAMASLYAEARGDFKTLQGDNAGAYKAYNEALAVLSPEQSRQLLTIKRDQVKPDPIGSPAEGEDE